MELIKLISGREPKLQALKVTAAGIKTDANSMLIVGDDDDRTNVPHIYAIGDIQHVCCM